MLKELSTCSRRHRCMKIPIWLQACTLLSPALAHLHACQANGVLRAHTSTTEPTGQMQHQAGASAAPGKKTACHLVATRALHHATALCCLPYIANFAGCLLPHQPLYLTPFKGHITLPTAAAIRLLYLVATLMSTLSRHLPADCCFPLLGYCAAATHTCIF